MNFIGIMNYISNNYINEYILYNFYKRKDRKMVELQIKRSSG